MMRATELAHLLMRQSLEPGDCVVDATVGNGHDTLLLAELVGKSGRVIGFDVQDAALAAAKERLDGLPQVSLIRAGHENLAEYLPVDQQKKLAGVMFNLGYLPGASKVITTCSETTLPALKQALAQLKINGLVTLVLYPGHIGGEEEAEAVWSYAQQLPQAFAVTRHVRINSLRPAPQLMVIERLY
jgi:SAM-dependent methyltransferase